MKLQISNKIINIRPATSQDYTYCYTLSKKNMSHYYVKHGLGWKPKIYRKNFNPKKVKVIEYNKRRMGFYVLEFREKSWYIADIQLSSLLRGKGLGTKILEIIELFVVKKGKQTIQLRVFADNPAKKLYEKLGYKTLETKNNIILMIKKI